jgi:outer membrane receptor protein involved in Fe transport
LNQLPVVGYYDEKPMKTVKSPIALALLLSSPISLAQTSPEQLTSKADEQSVEVITVHADYRSKSLQKTASSLTVLSAQEIALRSGQNLEELTGAVANVNFSSGSQRARYYQIRGIGERSQFQEPINPSVGIIIDDIDFSAIGSVASTFDMAQVEVLKGPQGTRFGANAMAGLIYMSSNDPSDTFESAIKLTAGNYGSLGTGVLVSGPANDKVNYRLSAEKYQSDGFIENTYLGRDDTNNRDELSIRSKLAIQASDYLDIDLALLHFDFDNGYDAFSLDNTRQTLSDQPGFDQQKTTAMSAKFTYTKIDAFQVVSVLSHANSDLAYGYDEDWAYDGIHPYGYSSTDHYFRDRKTSTAEVRLISQPGHALFSGSTAWLTGFYFKDDQEDLQRQYTYLENDFTSEFSATTLAFFAEFDTQLNERLHLTTGIRVEQRDSDYDNSGSLAFNPKDTMLGGKLVLSYQVNDEDLLYASINRGFKAGSVNTSGSLPDELREFDPEYLWNVELGYKASFLDDSAYLRAAIFYMSRDDIQISSYHLDQRDDGSAEFISYWDNAAKGYNQGLELEGGWNLTDNLELYGALGLISSEFKDYIYADGTKENGRDQAHAPSYQFNLGANYFVSEQWQFNLSVEGKDAFYFSASHSEKSDSMTLLNGSVSYLQDNWQLKLWARNMLDEDYATRGFYFGNDPRDDYAAKAYTQLGEPAVVGLTLDYQF